MARMSLKSGTKSQVLRLMAEYAIRDQKALIDALTPPYQAPDEETQKAIDDAKNLVADFRQIAKSLSN